MMRVKKEQKMYWLTSLGMPGKDKEWQDYSIFTMNMVSLNFNHYPSYSYSDLEDFPSIAQTAKDKNKNASSQLG